MKIIVLLVASLIIVVCLFLLTGEKTNDAPTLSGDVILMGTNTGMQKTIDGATLQGGERL